MRFTMSRFSIRIRPGGGGRVGRKQREHALERLTPWRSHLRVPSQLVVTEVEGVGEQGAVGRLFVGEAEVREDAPKCLHPPLRDSREDRRHRRLVTGRGEHQLGCIRGLLVDRAAQRAYTLERIGDRLQRRQPVQRTEAATPAKERR